MLPPDHRLRRSEEFTSAVRRGRRAGRQRLVLHLYGGDGDGPGRVGFTVGKIVGGAVVRNRVRRRLRHLVRVRIHRLPQGSLLVVRANPKAASARYDELATDLDAALDRLTASPEVADDAAKSG